MRFLDVQEEGGGKAAVALLTERVFSLFLLLQLLLAQVPVGNDLARYNYLIRSSATRAAILIDSPDVDRPQMCRTRSSLDNALVCFSVAQKRAF
jgi:hypothetical protein